MICFHLYRIRKNVFIISFILFSSQNISPLGFCVADKIFGVLIEAMLWLPVSQKAWHEDLTATSSVEWGRRLQWKDIAPVTQINSFTLGKGHGRESPARGFGAFVMEAGKTRQHREPLTWQVPHADLAGLLTPALVSICPGLPSLWRSLCLTLKIIFHKNSLLIPSTTVVWRSTVKTEEGVCCRVWALEGDWVPKVCISGWDTNWGVQSGGRRLQGARCPGKVWRHLEGDDLNQGHSAPRWRQSPCRTGTQHQEKVSSARNGFPPVRLPRGPGEPEPLGPRGVRPGACIGFRPLLANSRYTRLRIHKEINDLVRVHFRLNF